MSKKINLVSDDYYRVLLSDMQPYHMPLIFSNKGFYRVVKSTTAFKNIRKSLTEEDLRSFSIKNTTIPFSYFINKNSQSLREISLIHPFQQLKFVDFYRDYSTLILYNCKKSRFSLRYPAKKNSTVYKPRYEKICKILENEFKAEHPDMVSEDKELKYASTFFSYKKYDFNYKFYESEEFIRLERKYPYLKMIDVARCFDSIYTHSISWAVKGKDYIKNNIPSPKDNLSFEESFDRLMQEANYQETNGILIGSEVSRIFAEIIFQQIDDDIIEELNNKKIINNKDYTIRRYVDDYCIFSATKSDMDLIVDVIANKLKLYKLHINSDKTKEYIRPFITNRSRNITELRGLIKRQMEDVLKKISIDEKDEGVKGYYYSPNKKILFNPMRLSVHFIKDLKSYWHVEGEFETGFSNYLLKTLNEQVLMFIKKFDIKFFDDNYLDSIINYFIFIFNLSLYAFSLEPKVTQSFTFSRIILVMTRFSKAKIENYHEKLAHIIHTGLIGLLQNELSNDSACIVERLNILLTLNDVGECYLPNENILKKYIYGSDESNINYFSLISGLFIVQRKSRYENLKKFIVDKIKERIKYLPRAKKSSEALHLYMDAMSCPYIDDTDKKAITKIEVMRYVSQNQQAKIIEEYVNFFSQYHWFVDWDEIDILSKLFRKQLRRAY